METELPKCSSLVLALTQLVRLCYTQIDLFYIFRKFKIFHSIHFDPIVSFPQFSSRQSPIPIHSTSCIFYLEKKKKHTERMESTIHEPEPCHRMKSVHRVSLRQRKLIFPLAASINCKQCPGRFFLRSKLCLNVSFFFFSSPRGNNLQSIIKAPI